MNNSKIFQLDMFKSQEQCEIDSLYVKIDAIDKSTCKVRKAMFARHGEIFKKVSDLEERLALLERNICKGVQ